MKRAAEQIAKIVVKTKTNVPSVLKFYFFPSIYLHVHVCFSGKFSSPCEIILGLEIWLQTANFQLHITYQKEEGLSMLLKIE